MKHFILRAILQDKEVGLRPTEVNHTFQNLEDLDKKVEEIAKKYPEATFKRFELTEF